MGVVRGPEPKEGEAVAISQAAFIAFDGGWVWPGRRLHLYDEIAHRHGQFSRKEVPRD